MLPLLSIDDDTYPPTAMWAFSARTQMNLITQLRQSVVIVVGCTTHFPRSRSILNLRYENELAIHLNFIIIFPKIPTQKSLPAVNHKSNCWKIFQHHSLKLKGVAYSCHDLASVRFRAAWCGCLDQVHLHLGHPAQRQERFPPAKAKRKTLPNKYSREQSAVEILLKG